MGRSFLFAGALLLAGLAQAELVVIGHVEYQASMQQPAQTFRLIWDDADEDGESVVWLDYTANKRSWDNQQAWVALLNGPAGESPIRSIVLAPGYSLDWGNNPWRLPRTVDGVFAENCSGTTTGGYNVKTSELGHLFYQELRNSGKCDTSGQSPAGFGLVNKGPFEHIAPAEYWSGTTYQAEAAPPRAWFFRFSDGLQGVAPRTSEGSTTSYRHALALRKATVRYRKPAGAVAPTDSLQRDRSIDSLRRN